MRVGYHYTFWVCFYLSLKKPNMFLPSGDSGVQNFSGFFGPLRCIFPGSFLTFCICQILIPFFVIALIYLHFFFCNELG
uniref:Ovule protein n=1 Tax=Panagrolaimus sp. PS1159 TaxID=55785 RepID=A0AC35GI90_9BILA